jgi:Lrp/AsnC family leucine-responsive transcriptional regulator
MIELDRTDRRILDALQADGRMTNADLAARINLSPSACLRRVRRLEVEGVIGRYVMLLDQAMIGRPGDVFVEITLRSQHEDALDAFERAAMACPEVMECYLMAGDADYILRLAVADAADYERIHRTELSRLPGVDRIRSRFALRTVCKKTAFKLL